MTICGVAVPGTEANPSTSASDAPPSAGGEPTPAAARPPYRKLYRSPHSRMLGGVAHGLAVHLGLPVVWVRAAFVLLTFANGIGVLLYAAFWFVVPIGIGEPGPAAHWASAMSGPTASSSRPVPPV